MQPRGGGWGLGQALAEEVSKGEPPPNIHTTKKKIAKKKNHIAS